MFMRYLLLIMLSLGLANIMAASRAPEDAPDASPNIPGDITQPGDKPQPVQPHATRGQLLYENHCMHCHASTVHIRNNRKAKSRADVRGWVSHWQKQRKLEWTAEEIEAVTEYLADKYYKF